MLDPVDAVGVEFRDDASELASDPALEFALEPLPPLLPLAPDPELPLEFGPSALEPPPALLLSRLSSLVSSHAGTPSSNTGVEGGGKGEGEGVCLTNLRGSNRSPSPSPSRTWIQLLSLAVCLCNSRDY